METVATKKATIRPVELRDMVACVTLIGQLREQTYWKHIDGESHEELMGLYITHRLVTNANVCLFVADVDGEIVGLCGGEIVSHWLAPQVSLLGEWAWYLKPEHKHGTLEARLWLTVVAWAKAKGVHYGSETKVLSCAREGRVLGREEFTMKEL